MLAQAGLAIPSLAAPTTPALRACPHCKHPDTISLPDYPGQWVCPECLRISDELHDEGFGARRSVPVPAKPKPAPTTPRPAPIKFATAPNPTPPTPKLRPGRGIPYCQKCAVVMETATSERTQQDGHICRICGGFLPLGSYRAIELPIGN